jgi:hypothetical protein
MNLKMNNGKIVIDGREFRGSNVSISNGKVTIDGVIQDGELSGTINVEVHGDVQVLENQAGNITAHNVGEISTGSGDIKCGYVEGNIRTGSGDVVCGDVNGNIRTGSGDVTHK